jgi:hypothetical protein
MELISELTDARSWSLSREDQSRYFLEEIEISLSMVRVCFKYEWINGIEQTFLNDYTWVNKFWIKRYV